MTVYATAEQNLVFEEKTLVRFFFSKEEAPEGALIVKNLPVRDDECDNFLTSKLAITDTTIGYTDEAYAAWMHDLENYEEF